MSTRNAAKSRPESPAPPAPSIQWNTALAGIDETLKMLTGKINNIDENQILLSKNIDDSVDKLYLSHSQLSTKLEETTSRVHNLIEDKFTYLRDELHTEFSHRFKLHDTELSTLRAENTQLKETCTTLTSRVDALAKTTAASENARVDLVNKLELFEKESDIIIRGIPMIRGEDCRSYFEKIAQAIGYSPGTIPRAAAFRIGAKKTGPRSDPPILVRFTNRFEKSDFFRCYLGKLTINLHDIGFDLGTRIYLSENLTLANQKIFNEAMAMKRDGKLFAVKTRFGTVMIQRKQNDRLVSIRSISDLRDSD